MYQQLKELADRRGARPRLLVVDDQPLNIRVIHSLFKDNYEIFMATEGEQAIALCQAQAPDLILLDVVMPCTDGNEVCRRLKADSRTRDIPVIFLTAQRDDVVEAYGFELGAVDFIGKPINATILQARVAAHLALKLQSDLLKSIALIDGLTGVENRRKFDEDYAKYWLQCARNRLPLSVIMIDVDLFKRFNDHYGHQAGDDCLRRVAQALKQCLKRPYDMVARYGGEEFACTMPETDSEGALLLANRMVERVRGLGLAHAASEVLEVVTISVGVATAIPESGRTAADLVAAADKQLYEAKRSGRNKVLAIDLSAVKNA